jgi:hypothetical protein
MGRVSCLAIASERGHGLREWGLGPIRHVTVVNRRRLPAGAVGFYRSE